MALTVNGELVEDSLLAREAEALRQRFERLSDEQKRQYGLAPGTLEKTAVEWARENVVEQVLLRQKALADPAPVDAEAVEKGVREAISRHGGPEKFAEAGLREADVRSDIEAQMKIQRLIASVSSKARDPKPKELAQHYQRNKERFRTEESVRAAHIVKHVEKGVTEAEAEAAAKELYKKLQAGTSFEQLADQHSDCPGNGGDLGCFGRGKMVKEFEEVVFGLRPGETSGVFKTVFGFHVAKVLDRRSAGVRAFGEVRDELRKELVEQRQTKLLEDYVDGLRDSAVIEETPGADAAGE